jgi:putative transposase
VHAQFDRIVDAMTDKLPQVAAHLDAARPDILASTASPKRRGGRSGRTTPRNRQIEISAAALRSSASSLNAPPLVRLVGAVLAEPGAPQ